MVADVPWLHMPSPGILAAEQRYGDPGGYCSDPLHAEPYGSFPVTALVWRPGQATPIHDHIAWCVFGVIQGAEYEKRYALRDDGRLEQDGWRRAPLRFGQPRPDGEHLDMQTLDHDEAHQAALEAGLLVRRADPLNCETPLPVLGGGLVVPNALFYVRDHFGIPDLDADSWRLDVGGLVGCPLSVDRDQLRAMPSVTAVVTLECAGNGRAGFEPPAPGEQWGLGAVSTAEWTGVPLTEVLDQAGVQSLAREAVFCGADSGHVDGRHGRVRFERSLPVSQLGQAGALLAYAMNGEELPAHHGYPLRLVVPGWYAVASVKWLTQIQLTGRPFRGHFQADRYHISGKPLSLQRVRSLITEPAPGGTVEPGDIAIRGLAWSGAAPIARVEVRVDGAPWRPATLAGEHRRHSWQPWELSARLAGPGNITIRARATDLAGQTQPDQPQWNPLGYANNAIHQVRLAVARALSISRRPNTPAPAS